MERQHPLVSALAETMTDIAFFGFLIFFMLRPYILDFSFIPLAAGLFLFRLFNMFLLRRPITIGIYTAANVAAGGVFVFFSIRLLTLSSFQLLQAAICLGGLVLLVLRAIYLSVSRSARPLGAVTVDVIFILCLIISIWQSFSSVPGLSSLMAFSLWALACGIGDLAFQHMPVSEKKGKIGLPVFITGGVAFLFVLFSFIAAEVGKNVSNGLISAVIAVFTAIVNLIKYLLHLLEQGILFFFSLFPETAYEGEMYEMSDSFLIDMQEVEARDPHGLILLLGICLLVLIVAGLYWIIKKHVFRWRIPIRTTVKSQRRTTISPPGSLRPFLQNIFSFFRQISLLLFRSNHIASLLIRAEWYGKKHLHPRHKWETIREYLLRLTVLKKDEDNEYLKKGASLLSDYGDQYLYGAKAVQPDKKEILIIKKAFPLLLPHK